MTNTCPYHNEKAPELTYSDFSAVYHAISYTALAVHMNEVATGDNTKEHITEGRSLTEQIIYEANNYQTLDLLDLATERHWKQVNDVVLAIALGNGQNQTYSNVHRILNSNGRINHFMSLNPDSPLNNFIIQNQLSLLQAAEALRAQFSHPEAHSSVAFGISGGFGTAIRALLKLQLLERNNGFPLPYDLRKMAFKISRLKFDVSTQIGRIDTWPTNSFADNIGTLNFDYLEAYKSDPGKGCIINHKIPAELFRFIEHIFDELNIESPAHISKNLYALMLHFYNDDFRTKILPSFDTVYIDEVRKKLPENQAAFLTGDHNYFEYI